MPEGSVLKLNISEFLKVAKTIENGEKRLKDNCRKLMKIVSNELMKSSNRAFENEKDPETGEKWEDYSQSYILHLRHIGREGQKKLDLSNQLKKSIQHFYIDTEGGVGTNKKYAPFHQLGVGESKDEPKKVTKTRKSDGTEYTYLNDTPK